MHIPFFDSNNKLEIEMIIQKPNIRSLQVPAKGSPLVAYRVEKYRTLPNGAVASPRPRRTTGQNSSLQRTRSSARRNEMVAPRRRQANKEIVRRALTPPARRLTLRWLDFRPTPSRLSNMSSASKVDDRVRFPYVK